MLSDTRTDMLKGTHDREARELFDKHNETIRRVAQSNPQAAPTQQATAPANAGYTYTVTVNATGLLVMNINATFYDADSKEVKGSITGIGGGLILGAFTSYGTAWLNFPIETLKNRKGSFNLNTVPLTVNLNLWLDDGSYVGSSVSCGPVGLSSTGGACDYH